MVTPKRNAEIYRYRNIPFQWTYRNSHQNGIDNFESSGFSFLPDWPLFLHFFLSPQLLTATHAVVLQFFFFFFSLSLLIFFVLFWCPRELLLTKLNLSKRFSILTYQATHVANYCPHNDIVFFFFFFFSLNSIIIIGLIYWVNE